MSNQVLGALMQQDALMEDTHYLKMTVLSKYILVMQIKFRTTGELQVLITLKSILQLNI